MTILRVVGLMSGTSLDGIDAALIETDGETVAVVGPALTVPYEPELRDAIRGVLGGRAPERVPDVERALTVAHVGVVRDLLDRAGGPLDIVGFHGHTIDHRPHERVTRQIGDGDLLAAYLNVPVVQDFRSADVTAGGEGAPLVPVYHRALAASLPKPLAVLNLGGVGNITWIGADDSLLAFDTGPGVALLDDWVRRHAGVGFDADGALSSAGTVDEKAVSAFVDHDYFRRRPPKSLDRDAFGALAGALVPDTAAAADGAATLASITAACVDAGFRWFPEPPKRLLVTGGGRHNRAIMAGLRHRLPCPVEPVSAVGWDGDALEAQAFAFLAVRTLKGLPISFPGTTGVPEPLTGGVVRHP